MSPPSPHRKRKAGAGEAIDNGAEPSQALDFERLRDDRVGSKGGFAPFAPAHQRGLRVKVERDHSFARPRRGDGKRRRQRGLSRSAFLRKQCNGAHFDSRYD